MDQQIAEVLVASGPLGAALALLGIVLRGWIQRLQNTTDELGKRVEDLRNVVQEREVRQAQELAKLDHHVNGHAVAIEKIENQVAVLQNGVRS